MSSDEAAPAAGAADIVDLSGSIDGLYQWDVKQFAAKHPDLKLVKQTGQARTKLLYESFVYAQSKKSTDGEINAYCRAQALGKITSMKSMLFKKGETSNMWTHLRNNYKQLCKALEAEKEKHDKPQKAATKEGEAQPAAASGTAASINSIRRHLIVVEDVAAAASLAMFQFALLLLVLNSNLPFSFVTGAGLATLMATVQCPFPIPGRAAFVKLMVEVYHHSRDLLKKMICADHLLKVGGEHSPFLHLSCDFWTSRDYQSFGTIVMTWIDSEWRLQTRTLATAPSPGSHTSANLMLWLDNVLFAAIDIGLQKVLTFTSDGAADMRRLFTKEVQGKDWCHCLSHRVNLAVSWAMGAGNKVKFYKCQRLTITTVEYVLCAVRAEAIPATSSVIQLN